MDLLNPQRAEDQPSIQASPIAIDKGPVKASPIAIDAYGAPAPPSDAVASSRANKMAQGLGPLIQQNYDEIKDRLSMGQEDSIRFDAAARIDFQNTLNRQQRITDATRDSGRVLTIDEVNKILDPNLPENRPAKPGSIAERAYAHKAINAIEDAHGNMVSPLLEQAREDTPHLVEKAKENASSLVTAIERARKEHEDISNVINKQSVVGYIVDWTKMFVQPYDELKTRNLVPGGTFQEGGGLGSNWDAQTSRLIMKPQDEQDAFWESPAWTKLKSDNPQLALQFLNSFLGQTSNERVWGDLNSILNIPTALSGVKGIVGATKAVRNLNYLRNGIKQVAEASQAPHPTPASLAAAAGDLDGAAARQAVENTFSELNGTVDPIKQDINALPAVLRSDQKKLYDASPGREVVNRLNESNESLISTLEEHNKEDLKVPHAQDVTSSEEAMKAIIKEQKKNYHGVGNRILESTGPHRDLSGALYILHKLGKYDGTHFGSWEEARGAAELEGIVTRTPKAYVDSLDSKIGVLKDELKTPPDMHADVNELNRHVDMQNELDSLVRERANIERRGPEGYPIDNQGLGYYISLIKPVNEVDQLFNSFVAQTTESRLQPTWLKGWMRWWRTPAETLSKLENQARVIATHGPSILLEKFSEASAPITSLKRGLSAEHWADWERAVDYARQAIDPVTKRRGWFFDNIPQLEEWYQTFSKGKRLPSDHEVEAYFTFKRNVEAERQLRVVHMISLKARLGAEQHSVSMLGKDGKAISSNFVEGVLQKEAPAGGDTVLVMGTHEGEEQLYNSNSIRFSKIKKEIEEGGKGWQSMRVIDPDRTDAGSFKNFGKVGHARVRWVVSKKFETKPLSYSNQINRTGGGHFVIDAEHYLKYPRMSTDPITGHENYNGDVTIMALPTASAGEKMAGHLDEIGRLIKFNNIKRAKEYHTANQIPIPFEDIKGWYKDTKTPEGGFSPARIRHGEKFRVVPKNALINDMDDHLRKQHGDLFRDRTRQGNDMRQAVVEFAGERDAYETYSLEDEGSRGNPLYKYEQAKMIDPIATYNRALARITNSVYIDHYKINAVMHWIAQAKELMKTDAADLLHSPFYYFSKPDWAKNADPIKVSALMSAKYNIDQFVGVPSKIDAHLNAVANRLADSIYNTIGPKAGNTITDAWSLHYVRNPIAFIRAVTFHAKMGLFSIPQFFMQLMTATNVLAIGGAKHFHTSMSGTLLHQWSRLNSSPEILAHLDKLATKMGWRPGEWTEFNKLMKETGFENIGGEHAFRDAPWTAKAVKHLGQDILDWGELPFREGAKSTRIVSMAMAYREFREGPKTGKGIIDALRSVAGEERPDTVSRRGSKFGALSQEDKAAILHRAADLDHNMSRAANSMTHTGIMAPIGQFTAYSTRLMELMTGKRLTWQEKARLFGVSSVLYGVPIGGIGLYGFPIGDYLRSKAKDQGYVVGDNFLSTVVGEGLPSALTGVIFDTNINFSGYGAKGIDPVGEVMWSDSPFMKIFGGAAASTLANIWTQSSGLRNVLASHITGSQQSHPMTAGDVFGFFQEIASVNALVRGAIAFNTGNWVSKNGSLIQDNVSAAKALMQTFSGRVDQKVADVTVSINAQKAQKATETWVEHEYPLAIHRAIQAFSNKDYDLADKEFARAKWIMNVGGDYPIPKRAALVQRALQPDVPLISRLNFDRLKDAPASKVPARLEQFTREQELNKQRGQP